jgi:hypothetical protein
MKDYEDEAFDELEKSLQRNVATGVTDGNKKDAALRLALDALGAYLSATDEEEDAHAHSLMAGAFFKLKEALEDK